MGAYDRFGISDGDQNDGWEQMGVVSHDIPDLHAIAKYILGYFDEVFSCCVAENKASALSLGARHKIYWHVYVFGPGYFVWPWNLAYRTMCDVTRGGVGKQWTVGAGCGGGGRETINFILHTRCVNTCGRALWGGVNNEQKLSAVAHVIIGSCYKYGRYRHWCR
jgi:hypothetical protein